MPDAANPFIPGQPVASPSLFFGRRSTITWIRDSLVKGQRLLVISGAPRVGKTSLLRQLPAYLYALYSMVRVDVLNEGANQLDRLLWCLADLVARELSTQLRLDVPRPAWSEFEGHTEYLLKSYWPEVRALLGGSDLLLLLDDVDGLAREDRDLVEPLFAVLRAWIASDPRLALVMAATLSPREREAVAGQQLPLQMLGPLTGDESVRLVTEPVTGLLTYDFGVARRLVEITSGQPYYLHLFGFELVQRCAASGWVNQRDVDAVLASLVRRDILEFRQEWDASSPQEQAVLAALVSLRVSRGVATALEVHTLLTQSGSRVERQQVADVLEQLVGRGVLDRLGALSYRFRISLFSDWLRERVNLPKLVRAARWAVRDRERERPPAPPKSPPEPAALPEEPAAPAAPPPRRLRLGAWAVPAIVGVLALAAVLWLALGRNSGPQPKPSATVGTEPLPSRPAASPTVLSAATDAPVVPSPALATPAPTAAPPPTATPPLVVSRPIPAIAYQSRPAQGSTWSIYVMDSQGASPTRLTDGQTSAMSPSWSPDGSRVAFVSDRDGNPDIWAIGLDGSGLVNLTRHSAQDQWPAWSPDGQWIAFASVRDAPYWELYVMRSDGSDASRLTHWDSASDLSPTWSPDSSRLAFASKRDGNWEIYIMDRDGDNLVRLTFDPADDTNPAWSPDGSRIAFESTRTGYADIFVMPVAGGDATNLTNQPFASDHGPTWSPDGSRLAFFSDRGGDWDIYVMASDGSVVVRLTGDSASDQVPSWRP